MIAVMYSQQLVKGHICDLRGLQVLELYGKNDMAILVIAIHRLSPQVRVKMLCTFKGSLQDGAVADLRKKNERSK